MYDETMLIPLFTSAYSFRSILTLAPKLEEDKENYKGSDSIFTICDEEKLDTVILVEDNLVGFLEAQKNSGDVKLIFGLRINVSNNLKLKAEDDNTICKYIIFCKNQNGFDAVRKIFTFANTHSTESLPRIDFANLKKYWNDNLMLAVPFYDSFIHKNCTQLESKCIPDFKGLNPVFFIEDNGLFFDKLIEDNIQLFDKKNEYVKHKTKSIFYKNRDDFLSWQTYRCIQNRSTLEMPNLDYCGSNNFCVESWKENK